MIKIKNINTVIVIFYYPTKEQINYIYRYIKLGLNLVIVDNSDNNIKYINILDIEKNNKITYIKMGKNMGIAYALNLACNLVYKKNEKYVLTMDQDSQFKNNDLMIFIQNSEQLLEKNYDIGIIGVQTRDTDKVDNMSNERGEKFKEVDTIITSGNIVNLNLWDKIGKFDENLFIDQVDHEYCYRLRKNKYKIIQHTEIRMSHKIGNPIIKRIMFYKMISRNHSPIRRYYQIRNTLYLKKKYPEYSKNLNGIIKDYIYHLLGIIFLEKKVTLKLYYILLGIMHYKKNRYGSYEGNDKL